MATHAVSWLRYEELGAEYAELSVNGSRLNARSTAIGATPVPYLMDLEFVTGDGFVTSRLAITTRGQGWSRRLDLRRSDAGVWSADVAAHGAVDLAGPGGALA